MQICDHVNGHGWCPNIVNELTHLSPGKCEGAIWPSLSPCTVINPILLTPGKCGDYFKSVLFKLLIQNSSLGAHCKIVLRWMPQNLMSEKSTLVQVMAWCRQATSHYLDQCCPRSLMPYGIISPWWVNVEKVRLWNTNCTITFVVVCRLCCRRRSWRDAVVTRRKTTHCGQASKQDKIQGSQWSPCLQWQNQKK